MAIESGIISAHCDCVSNHFYPFPMNSPPPMTLSASATSHTLNRRFTAAPMMDWSDSHCRSFWRLLSKHTVFYSEMITTGAIIHGDRKRFLDFNACEHPLALQLGGSDPKALAECARIAEDWGYDEINLNCGCPSERVQN